MEQLKDINDADTISAMASALLSGRTRTVMIGERTIEIQEAKMRHIPLILSTFNKLAQSVDQKSLSNLVSVVATRQIAAIKQGADPDDIAVPERELVAEAFGNVDLLTHLAVTLAADLPKLAAAFTTLPESEFDDLSISDGIQIVFAIVVLNYGFFSERLVPTLRALLGTVIAKKNASLPQSAANA